MKSSIAPVQSTLSPGDLEVLLALMRAGTLAQAARRLGADASTVAGIARHGERIEAELEAARALLLGAQGEVTGRVRLTTTDAVLRGLVLPVLPPLLAAHPGLQLELHAGNELLSLTRRDADLALRATPRPPQHLVGRHLGTLRFVVCGPRTRGRARKAAALDTLDWIAPDEALPEHPSVRWRRKHLPKVAPRHLVDGIVPVADAVIAGLGVGIVPLFMLQAEPRLVALSEPLEGCESQLWLLAHPESRHLRRIATVYGHFAQQIRLP